MRYFAFAMVIAVALYTVVYAARVLAQANRRGAAGLFLLSAGLVLLGWWVIFGLG
ncbi:MAG: hypothetical protein ACM3XZ_11515 [Betaproteobacteria bacterium]